MRLDKYLKVSRIIKRRAVGKELAQNDRVYLNDRLAKPSSEVHVGDILRVQFGQREITVRILTIMNQMKKGDESMFEILDQRYLEHEAAD